MKAHSPRSLQVVVDVPEYLSSLTIELRDKFAIKAATSLRDSETAYMKQPTEAALVDVRPDEKIENDRSGLELVKWLKSQLPDLPVVAMSAIDDPSLPDDALAAGAAAFLKKPVNIAELKTIFEELIKKSAKRNS
jgi:DNA-binding NtrC family response regulator